MDPAGCLSAARLSACLDRHHRKMPQMPDASRRMARPPLGVAMWTLTTSDGRRVADIRCEMDARRIVHTLGTTQLRGPYSWDVVDSRGQLFVAEIRHRSGGGGQ